MNAAVSLGTLAILALGFAQEPTDHSELTVADLAAYRVALTETSTSDTPPVPITFRDLWSHPETYQGRRVQVEGRIVRRFRQGAFGTFPPLVEAWAVTPTGDPFCLVFPDPGAGDRTTPASTTSVRFAGTFLKRIRYQGGDMPRLAPLIVGPRPPVALARPSDPAEVRQKNPSWLDGPIGLVITALVALILARQCLRRPVRRPLDRDPPPDFLTSGTRSQPREDGPSAP